MAPQPRPDGADPQDVAVIGLGEAGHRYAEDLARAGHRVRGHGRSAPPREAGYQVCDDLAAAVAGADLVLSLVGGHAAEEVGHRVLAVLPPGGVLADLNTVHPDVMERLAAEAAGRDRRFVDVAIMAPVPRAGARSPLLISGEGAKTVSRFFGALGADTEVLDGPAGTAARLKLLRSVLMKGLAVVLLEGLGAAAGVGQEAWMHRQILEVLGHDKGPLVERLVRGSRVHASRRRREMDDVVTLLGELDQPAWVAAAARTWFEHLAQLDGKHA